ncbi:MAG: hypothetical protein N2517_04625 [Ignavibacteria bacterium]|nr:hypothetical protein [Ignavibacteria bacterium]
MRRQTLTANRSLFKGTIRGGSFLSYFLLITLLIPHFHRAFSLP